MLPCLALRLKFLGRATVNDAMSEGSTMREVVRCDLRSLFSICLQQGRASRCGPDYNLGLD
jgi:hypothetical protein